MIDAPSNENDPVPCSVMDARGRAALLLSESMLHGLIARRILSESDAMDVIDTAIDIQRDMLAELTHQDSTMDQSLALLIDMQRSLRANLPND